MIDVKIGTFIVEGTSKFINSVSEDNKRLEGIIGDRVQKVFDRLNWNTTIIKENLAGNYIKENNSYNGNIGLLEKNLIDVYFVPNSINVLTRKIGLSRVVTSNEMMILQIVEPPITKATSDIMNVNIDNEYWALYAFGFQSISLMMLFVMLKSYLFIFKFSNKKFQLKNLFDLLVATNFRTCSLFLEQLKNDGKSKSMIRFMNSFIYLGIWLWNKLMGGLMQTEAFKIDSSKIISNFGRTLNSNLQACLMANEPSTHEFLDESKKIFSSMFPTKVRHLYRSQFDDIVNFVINYKTRIFISSSIFIKSVGYTICTYLKEQLNDHKVFIPRFIFDEVNAVYYYNLKSKKQIIDDINTKLSVAIIEQSLIKYQRNPSKINLIETDVQDSCVVRDLKVLEDATTHSDLDHKIKIKSFKSIMTNYFLVITTILIMTLIIFLIHWIKNKFRRNQSSKSNNHKLDNPLREEKQIEDKNLRKSQLNRLYDYVRSLNEMMKTDEFYIHINPNDIDIINQEYQLMRLKYKKIQRKIEYKMKEKDDHFQLFKYPLEQIDNKKNIQFINLKQDFKSINYLSNQNSNHIDHLYSQLNYSYFLLPKLVNQNFDKKSNDKIKSKFIIKFDYDSKRWTAIELSPKNSKN